MSRLLIINGSPRKEGVDATIAKVIAERMKGYGYESETVVLNDLDIRGCQACECCKRTGRCVQKDDMIPLYDKIRSSDMLILCSPIYYGAETGQMKTFIDRFYAMVIEKDGQRLVNFGNVKKASVLLTCGAPDGYMTYGGVLSRLTKTLKSMGVNDLSGTILCSLTPDAIDDSEKVKDYLESLEFQVEM